MISLGENLPEVASLYLRVFSVSGQLPQRTAGGTTGFGAESCQARQQKQNICLPTNVLFLFIQAAGLAYHHDAVVDIISLLGAVYHHAPACIFLRLDDIQHFVLMICTSYGIDDIQGFALIALQNHGIICYTNLNLTR